MRPKTRAKFDKPRNQLGIYMIELLIAIATSSALSAVMIQALSETMQFSNSAQDEVLATTIVQELIDNARNMTYSKLSSLLAAGPTYTWTNMASSDSTNGGDPRSLLYDNTLFWTEDYQPSSPYNALTVPRTSVAFNGKVTETVSQYSTSPAMLQVTVTCTWSEMNRNRSYSQNTLVSEYGIHNYD